MLFVINILTSLSSFAAIPSPEDCQAKCQLTYNCDFFVYSPSAQTCWLRTGALQKVTQSDKITGPKYCDGNPPASEASRGLY